MPVGPRGERPSSAPDTASGIRDGFRRLYQQSLLLATESTLGTVSNKVTSVISKLDVDLSTRASQATLALIKAVTDKLTFASENLRVTNQTYGEAVAEGDVVNHQKWRTNGIVTSVGTTETVVMGGATGKYAWPTAAITWYYVSSSANDTAAGTGCRTLTHVGIKGDGTVGTETITMNGTTRVATVGTYIAPVTAQTKCATWGTGNTNAGDISAYDAAVAGNVLQRIDATTNSASACVYYVPTGMKAFLKKILITNGGNGNINQWTTIRLYESDGAFPAFYRREPYTLSNGTLLDEFYIPPSFTAGTRLEMRAVNSAGTSSVTAKFIGWIETV